MYRAGEALRDPSATTSVRRSNSTIMPSASRKPRPTMAMLALLDRCRTGCSGQRLVPVPQQRSRPTMPRRSLRGRSGANQANMFDDCGHGSQARRRGGSTRPPVLRRHKPARGTAWPTSGGWWMSTSRNTFASPRRVRMGSSLESWLAPISPKARSGGVGTDELRPTKATCQQRGQMENPRPGRIAAPIIIGCHVCAPAPRPGIRSDMGVDVMVAGNDRDTLGRPEALQPTAAR